MQYNQQLFCVPPKFTLLFIIGGWPRHRGSCVLYTSCVLLMQENGTASRYTREHKILSRLSSIFLAFAGLLHCFTTVSEAPKNLEITLIIFNSDILF